MELFVRRDDEKTLGLRCERETTNEAYMGSPMYVYREEFPRR
jgi:hypothetical protein